MRLSANSSMHPTLASGSRGSGPALGILHFTDIYEHVDLV